MSTTHSSTSQDLAPPSAPKAPKLSAVGEAAGAARAFRLRTRLILPAGEVHLMMGRGWAVVLGTGVALMGLCTVGFLHRSIDDALAARYQPSVLDVSPDLPPTPVSYAQASAAKPAAQPAARPAVAKNTTPPTTPKPKGELSAAATAAKPLIVTQTPIATATPNAKPTPAATAPAVAGTDSPTPPVRLAMEDRVAGLNYLVLATLPTKAEAERMRDALAAKGVPASVEQGLPGWSKRSFAVVGRRGFELPKQNSDYARYVRELKSMAVQPVAYKWRAS
jgi:hypothetical protein